MSLIHSAVVTGRNEVLAKVIFSQVCVILSTEGGGIPACLASQSWGVSNFSGVSNFLRGLQFFGGSPIFWGVSNFGGSPIFGGSPFWGDG